MKSKTKSSQAVFVPSPPPPPLLDRNALVSLKEKSTTFFPLSDFMNKGFSKKVPSVAFVLAILLQMFSFYFPHGNNSLDLHTVCCFFSFS